MGRRSATPVALPQFVWSPAGPDRELLVALQNLNAGLHRTAAELLKPMRLDSDLRCHRLLVLATAAAGSGIAEHWVQEEPDSRDAHALAARAAVIRAIRAYHADDPATAGLMRRAWRVCVDAAEKFVADPVPCVALLHLAGIQAPRSDVPETALADLHGLLSEASRRDPASREGHFRLVIAAARQLGEKRLSFVNAAAFNNGANAPAGSPLHLLPLIAHLESFRIYTNSSHRQQVIFADQEWSTANAKQQIETAYTHWFAHPQRVDEPLLPDLHLLAHALYKARMYPQAVAVFEAIGPWAWSEPWRLDSTENYDAERALTWARSNCLEEAVRQRRRQTEAAPPRSITELHPAS